jgi:hypothetical protein
VVLAQHSDQVLKAIRSMADRQDLLLARKVEDLTQRVFELAAIIGERPAYDPDTNPATGAPIRPIRRLGMAWRGCRMFSRAFFGGVPAGWPPARQAAEAVTAISLSDRGSWDYWTLRLLQAASDRSQKNLIRPGPIDYSGLRGEGSIPVPLPPPILFVSICYYCVNIVFVM